MTPAVIREGCKSTMLHREDEDVHGTASEYRLDLVTEDR